MNREQWAKLTDEEKRVKVAELCGYTCRIKSEGSVIGVPKDADSAFWMLEVPDYLNDLNAMHEVENEMTKNNALQYQYHLAQLLPATIWNLTRATAAQRAEAFVLTMEAE